MFSSNCCFLTCIQVSQEAAQVVWHSRLLQNFPQFIVIHTVKDFGVVNKAEIDIFLELSCFFNDPVDIGNLISGSSAFSKTSLNIWKFSVHVLLKPGLENFEHYLTSVWDECNCAVVWTFFWIAFLWHWNEIWHFPVQWPLLSFPNLLAYWVQHFHSIIFSQRLIPGPLTPVVSYVLQQVWVQRKPLGKDWKLAEGNQQSSWNSVCQEEMSSHCQHPIHCVTSDISTRWD